MLSPLRSRKNVCSPNKSLSCGITGWSSGMIRASNCPKVRSTCADVSFIAHSLRLGRSRRALRGLPPQMVEPLLRRVGRVLLDAADEIERGVERLIVLRIRRDIGLRAGLLVAFGLEVAAQRSLAARVGARLEYLGHLLQHLDVGRDTLGLDGS